MSSSSLSVSVGGEVGLGLGKGVVGLGGGGGIMLLLPVAMPSAVALACLEGRIISGRCFSLWLCWLVPSGGAASLFNAIDGSTIGVIVPAICSSASAVVVTESAANLQMGRGACVLGWGGDRGRGGGRRG